MIAPVQRAIQSKKEMTCVRFLLIGMMGGPSEAPLHYLARAAEKAGISPR